MAPRYRLKLKTLDFISAVDRPAQEPAKVLLIKGKAGGLQVTCKYVRAVKTSDELGLVYGWAMVTSRKGEDYFDLQGDNISEAEMVKAAADFMSGARLSDEMHDGESGKGQVVFALPMTPDVAKGFEIETDTYGLMVAIKPSAEVLAKFKDGTYTGFSIAGTGERELVATEKSHGYCSCAACQTANCCCKCGCAQCALMRCACPCCAAGEPAGAAPCPCSHCASMGASEKSMTAKAMVECPDCEGEGCDKCNDTGKVPAPADEKRAKRKETDMTPEQIAKLQSDLTAANARADAAEKKLGEAQKSAADVVVYKSLDGDEYKASDDPRLVKQAKRADDAVKTAELEKRAAKVLKNLPGTGAVHVAILRALDGIADEATRKAAHESVAAGSNAIALTTQHIGHLGGDLGGEPESAIAKWDAAVKKAVETDGVSVAKASAKLMQTNPDLYDAVAAERQRIARTH